MPALSALSGQKPKGLQDFSPGCNPEVDTQIAGS
jgi:hypothetical protein